MGMFAVGVLKDVLHTLLPFILRKLSSLRNQVYAKAACLVLGMISQRK